MVDWTLVVTGDSGDGLLPLIVYILAGRGSDGRSGCSHNTVVWEMDGWRWNT